jgi:hypothetical protein
MNIKKISIILFFIIIILIFTFMSLISIPWIFGYQHHIIGFLGLSLMLSTIPIIFYILLKNSLKYYMIFYYILYFIFTSILNILTTILYTELLLYKNDEFILNYSDLFNSMTLFILSIFFSFQFPIIILCILVKNINNYNDKINYKYFIKNPLIYIFIFSLSFFPLLFLIF